MEKTEPKNSFSPPARFAH